MNMPVPVPGTDPGPQWGIDLNTCLAILDSHDHSSGKGVQITPAGLNINTDLSIGGNNLTAIRSVRLSSQGGPISGASDLGCLYESGNDLYYNDGAGNQIRMTQSGGISGTTGSISGLSSPATASWVSASSSFVWQSNVNTAANLDARNLILRNSTASSHGCTLQPPASMGADFALTLPTIPASTKIMTIDNTGTMAGTLTYDGTTIVNTSGVLSASTTSLVDGVSIQSVSNVLSSKNIVFTGEMRVNGIYGTLTTPALGPDGMIFFSFNATIVNVFAYIKGVGTGTTTVDLKVATSPGGTYSSIFSTPASFAATAIPFAYVDSLGTAAAGTGVTAPVLSTTSINAGSALRMDLTSVMANADTVGVVIHYKQR